MADEENPPKSIKQVLSDGKDQAAQKVEKALAGDFEDNQLFSFKNKAICYLSAWGYKQTEICAQLGVQPHRVKSVLSSDNAKKEIHKLQEKIFMEDPKKMFMTTLPSAFRTVRRVMLDKKATNSNKLMAADMIMDRALGKPTQEVKHESSTIRELISMIDQVNRGDAKIKNDDAIDAEFKEVTPEEKPKEVDPMDKWIEDNL